MALSRRDFLKVGGSACIVAGAGAALAGCSPSGGSPDSPKPAEGGADASVVGYEPVSFDQETDILIIGTGYAGLAAAMAPALAGKKIVLAEKQQMMGGDSAGSCCFMFANGTQLQLDAGIPTTIDEYWEGAKEKQTAGFDQYDWYPEWVKGKTYANTKFVDSAINDFGAKFQKPASDEELPHLAASVILPGDGIGTGGINILTPIAAKLEELGAEFVYNSRAIALIKDPEGAVIGARFEDTEKGTITDIKATATVLATGGFADNGEMVQRYIPDWANYAQLVHGCMGEGHKLGVAAGGALSGMDSSFTYCNLMGDIPNCTTWGY